MGAVEDDAWGRPARPGGTGLILGNPLRKGLMPQALVYEVPGSRRIR